MGVGVFDGVGVGVRPLDFDSAAMQADAKRGESDGMAGPIHGRTIQS
jgi:hypothetical protein